MHALVDLLRDAAQRWPDQPAVVLHGKEPWSWTYAQLWEQARRTGGYLRAAGVARGDRVLLWAPNRPEWAAAFFGIQIIGAVAIPWDARNDDVAPARRYQPAHAFAGAAQAPRLHDIPTTVLEELPRQVQCVAPLTGGDEPAAPDDVAELAFTSGTTGTPKAVQLTHHNLLANVEYGRAAFPPTPENRALSILPLSHLMEQAGGLFVPLSGGATIIYTASLRPEAIVAALAAYRVTNMMSVPAVLQLLREGIEREIRKQGRIEAFARLRRVARHLPLQFRRVMFRQIHRRLGGAFEYFVCGGAYLDPELARWWEDLGIKVAQGYGMTEAGPVIATNTLRDRDPHSAGRPPAGVEIRVADDGEILVRGPNITPGYLENPAANAAAFADGWFKTGDLGYLDPASRLHLSGRMKDLIVLSSGRKVYPEEVERVLTADPRVRDAVVLGVAAGQEVTLHAVLITDTPQAAAEIVRTANGRLTSEQRLRAYSVWPEAAFPLTSTLKPKRDAIAAWLNEQRTTPPGDPAAPSATEAKRNVGGLNRRERGKRGQTPSLPR